MDVTIQLAQDRVQRRVLLDSIVNLRSTNAEKMYLPEKATISREGFYSLELV
jgi:hypothetical protein